MEESGYSSFSGFHVLISSKEKEQEVPALLSDHYESISATGPLLTASLFQPMTRSSLRVIFNEFLIDRTYCPFEVLVLHTDDNVQLA